MMARDRTPVLSGPTLQTPFAEAYRALRTNINVSSGAAGVKAVLVTSATSGEGKSTTVANLGILMAQAGQRVIVLDADFRRPSLERLLPADGNGRRATGADGFWQQDGAESVRLGLAELIKGTATLVEVAISVAGVDNLSLIPTGVIPQNPAELLQSARMRALIIELCDHADVVLLDSPPCALYSDAVELTQVTDGILYVLRSGRQGAVNHQRTLKQLQQARARLIGVVMNQVDNTPGGYARYRGGAPSSG
jgi:capsular exopolysaccharide synthesis family protein